MNERRDRWIANSMAAGGLAILIALGIWRPTEAESLPVTPIDAQHPAAEGNYLIDKDDILSVYDGDTFFIRIPECAEAMPWLCKRIGVRIEGMDTPERKGLCELEEAQAGLAKLKLEEMLGAAQRIELVDVRREKYGRLLGGLLLDGQDVVEEMVLSGLARPYSGGHRSGWCQ